jgi:hypothetical protein
MSELAGVTSQGSFTPSDALIVGPDDPMTRQITLVSGENRLRGAVLGKITSGGTVTVGTVTFAGTGNGVLTKATPAFGAGAQNGNYVATNIEAATDSGTFAVRRPDGTIDGYATVGVAYNGQVKFTIADGSTDFVPGDAFTIPVTVAAPANNGKYKLAASAATDGSAGPVTILAEDCDASGGDKVTIAYFGGVFDENALTYGTGITAASAREALRDVGIKLQSSITR